MQKRQIHTQKRLNAQDASRDEVLVRLERSEERVAHVVEKMQFENERYKVDIHRTISDMRTSIDLQISQLRHGVEMLGSQIEQSANRAHADNRLLRSELLTEIQASEGRTNMALTALKNWVLAGALAAAFSILGVLGSTLLRPAAQAAVVPAQSPAVAEAPAATPDPSGR